MEDECVDINDPSQKKKIFLVSFRKYERVRHSFQFFIHTNN